MTRVHRLASGEALAGQRDTLGEVLDVIRRGPDSGAEMRLVAEFWNRVVGYVSRRLDSRVFGPSDVANDVLMRFLTAVREGRYPQLHDRESIFAMLSEIAKNRVYDLQKYELRKKRYPEGGVAGDSAAIAGPHGQPVPLGEGREKPVPLEFDGPDDHFVEAFAEELSSLFEELPVPLSPEERQLLKWDLDGLTNQEIADELRVSRRTVQLRLARIRERIRAACRGEE